MTRPCAFVRARLLAALLAACVIVLVPTAARADVKANIAGILAQASAVNDTRNVALAKQLVELGTQADSELFDELARECSVEQNRAGPRWAVLLHAFGAMNPQRWRPLLAAKLANGDKLAALAPIFAIEGRCGGAEDVPFVLQTAGFDHDGVRRTELEETLTRILLRQPPAFDAVDDAVPALPPELRLSLIRAVEATRQPRAALLLSRWIEFRREMRLECLPYLSRLSLALPKPLSPEVQAPVTALVESGDEATLSEALLCAGRLGDYEVIPALIRHLKEGEFRVRAEAHWALRTISGLKYGDDPREWSQWFELESRWWNNNSRQAFTLLARGSRAEKVEALRQVSTLHAWRDRAAAEVVVALCDDDAFIATMAATELRRLDSELAVPALVDALSEGRPAVAEAARAALQSITKRELPSDPQAVHELLVQGR
jgi:hypothetical protein